MMDMANLTEFSLADAIAVLSRTPATLNALLRGLPNVWVRGNEGKDTWNAFDIVGHLISWGAHRVDAAGGDHAGERRGAAI